MIRVFRPIFLGSLCLPLAVVLGACGSGQAAAPSAKPSQAPAVNQVQAGKPGASLASGRPAGREGGEGGGAEGGEGGGEGGPRLQRLAITLSDSGIQPSTLSARSGLVEFDVTNQGQQPHHVTVTGSGTNGDSGTVAPGKTAQFQGNLVAGTYQLKLDADKQPPGPAIPLTVQ